MTESILGSTKKVLGIPPEYTEFDLDLVMHINSIFANLAQLGVGPAEGFSIGDDSVTWDAFLGPNKLLNFVKTYMSLKVRLIFDPPATSFVIAAMQKQIEEFEFRINAEAEKTIWTSPEVSSTSV